MYPVVHGKTMLALKSCDTPSSTAELMFRVLRSANLLALIMKPEGQLQKLRFHFPLNTY